MSDTLTIALNGDVPLREFADAMGHFRALVESLSVELAGNTPIEWAVDSLESGSAIATIRGSCERAELVASVINAYTQVGKALQLNKPIPYAERVRKPALSLSQMLDGKITSIRFETEYADGAEGLADRRIGRQRAQGELLGSNDEIAIRRSVDHPQPHERRAEV